MDHETDNRKNHDITTKETGAVTIFKCDECDFETSNKTELRWHVIISMDGPSNGDQRNWTCDTGK